MCRLLHYMVFTCLYDFMLVCLGVTLHLHFHGSALVHDGPLSMSIIDHNSGKNPDLMVHDGPWLLLDYVGL